MRLKNVMSVMRLYYISGTCWFKHGQLNSLYMELRILQVNYFSQWDDFIMIFHYPPKGMIIGKSKVWYENKKKKSVCEELINSCKASFPLNKPVTTSQDEGHPSSDLSLSGPFLK